MSRKDEPWYPWVSVAGWTVLVFGLVFVNSAGNIGLAAALALVVGAITWRLERARRERRVQGDTAPPGSS